jgi:hypothetical protein
MGIDCYVVMPNHIHAILVIKGGRAYDQRMVVGRMAIRPYGMDLGKLFIFFQIFWFWMKP